MIDGGREYEPVVLECEGAKPQTMMRRLAEKWVAAEERRGRVCRIKPIPPRNESED